MLNTENTVIETLCRDLTGSRRRLHELLLSTCSGAQGETHAFACATSRRAGRGTKHLFVVTGADLAERVRAQYHQLLALRRQLSDLAGDLQREQGLWLPAVIDERCGDTQVNLMVHTSRHSREISTTELSGLMATPDYEALRPHLEMLTRRFPTVRLARDAGKAYRLTIRGAQRVTAATGGKTGAKPFEVVGLNDYAVVLGTVQVVLPLVGRFRATRRDAVYCGTPLLEFAGRRERLWRVYPPACV